MTRPEATAGVTGGATSPDPMPTAGDGAAPASDGENDPALQGDRTADQP